VDCRVQTGNLPSGVAFRQDGTRAYANNEANFSVTSMNVDDGFCLTLRLDSEALDAQTLWIFAAVLKSIDSTTPLFRSEADDFRDALRTQGTCPPPAPRPDVPRLR
jgi:hypothetical protein